MKVLVAYEHRYRFYREVIARGITNHRPHLHVRHSGLQELNSELALFDPEAVISSQPNSIDPTGGGYRVAWVELPVEPSCAADICLDGNHVKLHNPTLVEVVSVLDEAEALLHREDPRADSG
jgi:hypothetical protein